MAILTINGLAMPVPQRMRFHYGDVGKLEMNAAGRVVMDRLAQRRTLECGWGYLTAEAAARLRGAVNADTFLSVTAADPQTGAAYTGEYLREGVSCGPLRYAGDTPVGYTDIQLTLVER